MAAPKGHAAYNTKGEGGSPKIHTKEFIENEAEELNKWMQKEGNIFFNRFALMRGYHPQRLTEFAEKSVRFAEVFTMAKKWQELIISEGAITKEFSDGFSKFILINHHGWADKSETKVSGDAENPLSFLMTQADGQSKDLVNE
jgi:hypothetical protein